MLYIHQYDVPVFDPTELKNMSAQNRKQVKSKFSDHYSDEDKQAFVRDYFAFCAYGDTLVGQAVDAFIQYSEKHQRDWTVVFVCGDHGFKLNDHGAVSKFSSWDIDTHNPIVVVSSDQSKFPAGKVVTNFTEFVDIKPTILAAAGAKLSDPQYNYLDGHDLAKVANNEIPARDYIVGECHAVTGPRAYIRTRDYMFSMMTRPHRNRGKDKDWAFHASYQDLDPALYHFAQDPQEIQNLAFDKDYEKVAMQLRDKLLSVVFDHRTEVDWGKNAMGTEVYPFDGVANGHDGNLHLGNE